MFSHLPILSPGPFLLAGFLLITASAMADVRSWTGNGEGGQWQDARNWSGQQTPLPDDDVILDNRDEPLSYTVILPDTAVIIRRLRIDPSPGRRIELILPSSNMTAGAFSVKGPGYGIELMEGAVFRNASGIVSGESMNLGDSLILRNGARYIHQTRASHAGGIVSMLSMATGTEHGVFDFDVPRASYTISVSNRTYGCLELHATAQGAPVNYTGSGANPLIVRGDLRIGVNVSLSLGLSGNGFVQVQGDLYQDGGILNLATGTGSDTRFGIRGDLHQEEGSILTETGDGNPVLELNGYQKQEISMEGELLNRVRMRLVNDSGFVLRAPLTIPWILEMQKGDISTSDTAKLMLDSAAYVIADTTNRRSACINGPLQKRGLQESDHFLFPVGVPGMLRWIALKEVSGNFSVEYQRRDPTEIETLLGGGIDHVSRTEYWKLKADGPLNNHTKMELSFAADQSGGVTDPQYLRVASLHDFVWESAGNMNHTGDYQQGSLVSSPQPFIDSIYTLASAVNLENPLPLVDIYLRVSELSTGLMFRWNLVSDIPPVSFLILDENSIPFRQIAVVKSDSLTTRYSWISDSLFTGRHLFRIIMRDSLGNQYSGNRVFYEGKRDTMNLRWITGGDMGGESFIQIRSSKKQEIHYEIISMQGGVIEKGKMMLESGDQKLSPASNNTSRGMYVCRVHGLSGWAQQILFRRE